VRRDRTDRIDCQRSPSVDAPSPWAFLYAFVESSAAGGAGYVDRSADYRSRSIRWCHRGGQGDHHCTRNLTPAISPSSDTHGCFTSAANSRSSTT
jgi:hypothetical protein